MITFQDHLVADPVQCVLVQCYLQGQQLLFYKDTSICQFPLEELPRQFTNGLISLLCETCDSFFLNTRLKIQQGNPFLFRVNCMYMFYSIQGLIVFHFFRFTYKKKSHNKYNLYLRETCEKKEKTVLNIIRYQK